MSFKEQETEWKDCLREQDTFNCGENMEYGFGYVCIYDMKQIKMENQIGSDFTYHLTSSIIKYRVTVNLEHIPKTGHKAGEHLAGMLVHSRAHACMLWAIEKRKGHLDACFFEGERKPEFLQSWKRRNIGRNSAHRYHPASPEHVPQQDNKIK